MITLRDAAVGRRRIPARRSGDNSGLNCLISVYLLEEEDELTKTEGQMRRGEMIRPKFMNFGPLLGLLV